MNFLDIKNVINNGYCVGCGACAAISPNEFVISYNSNNGQIEASIESDSETNSIKLADNVCPFSSSGLNETEMATQLFKNVNKFDSGIGYYRNIYVSKVQDKKIYSKSSSGGIIRWLLLKLINDQHVKNVIHVVHSDVQKSERLFEYKLSNDVEEIINSATSSYYPVELSTLLPQLDNITEPVAITGIPCYIKAVRSYIIEKNLDQRLFLTIGLICGHMKSKFYAYMLAEQLGVSEEDLAKINFRKKIIGEPANNKGVEVTSNDLSKNIVRQETVRNLYGTDYGFGLFKYKACDFCDDVFAETADIVVGDAWLPKYLHEGHSLVVTRSKLFDDIIASATNSKELHTDCISSDDARASQDAGLRHRKNLISYRLYLEEKKGNWHPRKRHCSSNKFSLRNKLIQRLRILAREKSAEYYYDNIKHKDFALFKRRMNKYFYLYRSLYGHPLKRMFKLFFALINLIV